MLAEHKARLRALMEEDYRLVNEMERGRDDLMYDPRQGMSVMPTLGSQYQEREPFSPSLEVMSGITVVGGPESRQRSAPPPVSQNEDRVRIMCLYTTTKDYHQP